MAPAMPPARRLSALLCAVLGLAVLALSACGNGGGAAAATDSAPAAQPRARASAGTSAEPCPGQLTVFLKSLDALRRRLAAGLSYEQYAAEMHHIRASYDEIPIDHLTIDCLATGGTPSEKALNKYIDAANAWGECLADASCTTASIEPILQRKWRAASGFLSEAE